MRELSFAGIILAGSCSVLKNAAIMDIITKHGGNLMICSTIIMVMSSLYYKSQANEPTMPAQVVGRLTRATMTLCRVRPD
jgi:hypothetical protein